MSDKPFDPTYAPEGKIAKPEVCGCNGCCCIGTGCSSETIRFCMAAYRPDGCRAILVRKEEETSPWASLNAKPDTPLRIEQDTVYTFKKMLRTCDTCGNAICETRGKTIQPCGTWISKTPESATTDTWKDCYYYHVMPQEGWLCPVCRRINAPSVKECPCSPARHPHLTHSSFSPDDNDSVVPKTEEPQPGQIWFDATGRISSGTPATYVLLSAESSYQLTTKREWRAARFYSCVLGYMGAQVVGLWDADIEKLEYIGDLPSRNLRRAE